MQFPWTYNHTKTMEIFKPRGADEIKETLDLPYERRKAIQAGLGSVKVASRPARLFR